MGITARGAWISVERHFRELGLNPCRDAVTTVGIGDMSGDVFGNGMLLSENLRLVAAFDHRHVFVDPDPDPATAFAERRRLFALPSASWADYREISAGGGVWPRTAKTIPLRPRAREVLGIDTSTGDLTPADVIRAILRAPVDLLLSGPIPEIPEAATRLREYFPPRLYALSPQVVSAHPLARQIVATQLTNEIIDHAGLTYVHRLVEDTAATTADAARAFLVATEVFSLRPLWRQIRETRMPAPAADRLTVESIRLLDRASRWLLANRPQPLAVTAEISRFGEGVRAATPELPDWLCGSDIDNVALKSAAAVELGAPAQLARRVYRGLDLFSLLDIVEVADLADVGVDEVGRVYWALNDHLAIGSLLTAVTQLDRSDEWHALARQALREDIYTSMRLVTLDVLATTDRGAAPLDRIAEWEAGNIARLDRARTTLGRIASQGAYDLATLSVAARQLRKMPQLKSSA